MRSRRRDDPTTWLSIEARTDGVAVDAPDFIVWDEDPDEALAWASTLYAAMRRPDH